MIHLDHISISAKNIYEESAHLREETGLGYYDGGFFAGGGNANKIFPLGGSTYIEVGGIVDAFRLMKDPKRKPWWYDKVDAHEACFTGLCLRVDSAEELEAIAKRHNTKVSPNVLVRTRPDGYRLESHQAPNAGETWPKGLPNWYYFFDFLHHPSGQPVGPGPNLVRPDGIAWLEVGGTEKELTDWLGVPASNYPFKFNGKSLGLYAVGVKTDQGEVVVRRPCATEA